MVVLAPAYRVTFHPPEAFASHEIGLEERQTKSGIMLRHRLVSPSSSIGVNHGEQEAAMESGTCFRCSLPNGFSTFSPTVSIPVVTHPQIEEICVRWT